MQKEFSLLLPALLILAIPISLAQSRQRALVGQVTRSWENTRSNPDFEAGAEAAREDLLRSNPRYFTRIGSCSSSYRWTVEPLEAMRAAGAVIDQSTTVYDTRSWAWVAGYNDATATYLGIELEEIDRRTARSVALEELRSFIFWRIERFPDELVRLIDEVLLSI